MNGKAVRDVKDRGQNIKLTNVLQDQEPFPIFHSLSTYINGAIKALSVKAHLPSTKVAFIKEGLERQ